MIGNSWSKWQIYSSHDLERLTHFPVDNWCKCDYTISYQVNFLLTYCTCKLKTSMQSCAYENQKMFSNYTKHFCTHLECLKSGIILKPCNNKVHCDIVTHFNAKSVLCCCFSNNYCMSQNARPKKLLNYTTCKTIQARKVGFVWWKKFHFLLVKTCSCLLSPSLCVDERINFASEPQWTFFCFYLQRSAKLVKLFDQVRGLWKVAL